MMLALLHAYPLSLSPPPTTPSFYPLRKPHFHYYSSSSFSSSSHLLSLISSSVPFKCSYSAKAGKDQHIETVDAEIEVEEAEEESGGSVEEEGEEEEEFSFPSGFGRRQEEKDYDRDPELAEILGNCFEDPQKAQARVEERIRKKRSKILHTKTGSPNPINVTFNKFGFSNSYIWFEFYNAPLSNDISLICDTIRAWFIIGRLGGCNSMNMQLSQAPLDNRRPSYDAIEGANITPSTFYNIGDLEIQDNLARLWVDIGTSEPLVLDVLINALTHISSDYVGIKQLVFGGSEFESWKESLKSEDSIYSVHKI